MICLRLRFSTHILLTHKHINTLTVHTWESLDVAAVKVQQSIPGAMHVLQLPLIQTQPIATKSISIISICSVIFDTIVLYEYLKDIATGVDVQVRAPNTRLREVL